MWRTNTTRNNSRENFRKYLPPPWNRSFIIDSNFVPRSSDYDEDVLVTVCTVIPSVLTVLIVVSSLLVLIVILSSSSVRSKPRNKFLLSLLVSYLLLGAGAALTAESFDGLFYPKRHCHFEISKFLVNVFVVAFVCWWGVVVLLLHYLARVLRYQGPRWLHALPSAPQRAVQGLAVASPWVGALVVLVDVIHGDPATYAALFDDSCSGFRYWSHVSHLFRDFACFIVPVVMLVVLMIATKVVSVRQAAKTGGRAQGGHGDEVEPPLVYLLTAASTLLFMSPIYFPQSFSHSYATFEAFLVGSCALSIWYLLLPPVNALLWLLLFGDVRRRFVQLVATLPCCRQFGSSRQDAPEPPESTNVAFRNLPEE